MIASPLRDDSTRRICAAVYYDQQKAHDVLDLVGTNEHAFVAQHDGIDAPLVAAHAAASLATWRRHNVLVSLAAVSPFLVASVRERSASWIFAGALLILLGLLSVRFTAAVIGRLKRLERSPFTWFIFIGCALLIWWIVMPLFAALALFSLSLSVFVLPIALAFATDFLHRVWIHAVKLSEFRVDTWMPEPPRIADARLSDLIDRLSEKSQVENATVYSGYVPFVGAGLEKTVWNEAIDVQPLKDTDVADATVSGHTSQAVGVRELDISNELAKYLYSIDLRDTKIRRWHFVEGRQAEQIPGMLSSPYKRPIGAVNPSAIADGKLSDELVRPYLWLSGRRWGGDIVLNTFIRLDPRPTTIFVEIAHFVVAPIDERFERCDYGFDSLTWALWPGLLRDSVLGLFKWTKTLQWGLTRTVRWNLSSQRVRQRRVMNLKIDYGASSTIRDLFSSNHFNHYFQQMDEAQHRQTINVHLLTGINAALSSIGLEIARLDQVVQSLTQNVTISNSKITATNFNAGSGNTISESRAFTPKQPAVTATSPQK